MMQNKLMLALLFLIVSCSAPATPTQIVPTQSIPTPNPTAAPSPTATLTANENALQIFPLKTGAQWIYREEAYETIENGVLPQLTNRQITATLQVTDTVTEIQTHDAYYAAQVERERDIITTTIDLAQLGEHGSDYFANNAPATKWYIFAGDKVYSQFDDLDWNAVMSSTLELQLPFAEGERWYPDAEQRAQFSVDEGIPGLRVIETAPPFHLPNGDFSHCFVLHDFYNGGAVLTTFCSGVGIVREDFDHAGTPFGTHSELLKFAPGQ